MTGSFQSSMSKTLASEFPKVVKLSVIPDAGHNDILYSGKKKSLMRWRPPVAKTRKKLRWENSCESSPGAKPILRLAAPAT